MIRARASKRKSKRLQPSATGKPFERTSVKNWTDAVRTPTPELCDCGAAWSVAFPGDDAPEATGPCRNTVVLCMACAQARGWPNFKSDAVADDRPK